jgi:hypothetical protein
MSKQEKKAVKVLSTDNESCFLHPKFIQDIVHSGKLKEDGVYTVECTFTVIPDNIFLVVNQEIKGAGKNMVTNILNSMNKGMTPKQALADIVGTFHDASVDGDDNTGFQDRGDFEGNDIHESCDCALCKNDKNASGEVH